MSTDFLYIAGGGSFAIKLATMLEQHSINIEFIDEFSISPLLNRPVYKSSDIVKTDKPCLLAISNNEHADAAFSRLSTQGFGPSILYKLLFESAINVLEIMLQTDREKCLKCLAHGYDDFISFEADFFEDPFHTGSLNEQEQANVCSLKLKPKLGMPATFFKSNVGFYYIGKGGGFRAHVGNLPSQLSNDFNVREFSDQAPHSNALADYSIMSEQSMLLNHWADVVINPHFFECSPAHIPKITMMHMVYDFLVYKDLVAKVMQQPHTHYLFVPSKPSMKLHQQICKDYQLTNNMVLIPGGYPRLDNNIAGYQKKIKIASDNDTIIYAPTLSATVKADETRYTYSILGAVHFIPAILDAFPHKKIIFRPHPDDLSTLARGMVTQRTEAFRYLLILCDTHPRCRLDDNPTDYLDTFASACALISDTSAIAYSFALTTQKPVIFFSRNQQKVVEAMPNVAYINDREKIGYCVDTVDDLLATLKLVLTQETSKSKVKFCEQLVYNRGTSLSYLQDNFKYILSGEKHPDWWYWHDHC
jgi:hypothetical protein